MGKVIRHITTACVLCMLCIYPVAAQTVHQVAAGTDVLNPTITGAATGDIIELTTDGGIYLSADQIVIDKDITIRGSAALLDKPVLKYIGTSTSAYMFKGEGSPRIALENLEFDGDGTGEGGAALAKYVVRLDNGDTLGTMSLFMDNCVAHDFNDKFIKPYANCGIDSLVVTNSIFYNGASEGIVLYSGTSSDPAVILGDAVIENCTFYNLEREAIKGQTYPDAIVRVNRCTFYNLGEVDKKAMIYFRNMTDVIVKNSIFSTNPNTDLEKFADFASDASIFSNNVVWGVTNWDVGAATVTDTLQVDPGFADAANADFSISKDSPLMTYADDGGAVGDSRWVPDIQKIWEIAAGTDVIAAAIADADTGDIIELTTSGGLYLNNDQMAIGKDITIRGRATLPEKPILKYIGTETSAYMFKGVNSPRIALENLELDGDGTGEGGAALAKYVVRLDNGDTLGTMSLFMDNCVAHDFNDKFIKPYPNCGMDSLVVTNSIFYNGASEGIVLYSGTSSDPAVILGDAVIENCTFYNLEREAIKGQTYPDAIVRVNRCTFYNLGEVDKKAMIYFRNMTDVIVKNSIFATNPNTDLEKFADFASDASIFSNNVVWDVTNWDVGAATVTDTLQVDPGFADAANADFSLPVGSALLTYADDGGPIGDSRWAPLDGQYILSVYVLGEGEVTLDPPGPIYDEGAVVTLTAVPDPGWGLESWTGNVSPSFPPDANPVTVTINANETVTATFVSLTPKYQVSVTSIGIGHVDASPEPMEENLYEEGTEVTLTAVSDSVTWEFVYWVDAAGDSLTDVNPQVFTVAVDTAFTAMFQSTIAQVALNLTVVGMGDVDVNPLPVPGFETYDVGTEVSLEADADIGWEFEGYTGDVIDTADSIGLVLDTDKNVTATFVEISHPTGELAIGSDWDLIDAVDYANNNSQVTTIVLTDVGPYQPDESSRDPDNGRMPEITIESPVRIVAADALSGKPILKGYTSSTGSGSSEGFFRFRSGGGMLVLENLIIDGYLDADTDAYPAKYIFRADDGLDTVFCSLKAFNVDMMNCFEAFWKNYGLAMVDTLLFDNCIISDIGKEGLFLNAVGHANFVGMKNTTWTKVAREILYLRLMPDAVVDIDHVTIADCGFGYGSDPAKHGAVRIENTVDVQIRNVIIYKVLNTEYGYALRIAGANSVLDNVLLFESAEEISLQDDAAIGPDVFRYDPMFLGPDTGNYTLHDSSIAYHLASDESAAIGDLRWATSTNVAVYHTFSLTVGDSGAVTLDPEPMAKFYVPGTVVTTTAVPDAGWEFSAWSGDLTGSTNPATVTMDADKSITAAFTKIPHGIEADQLPTEYSLSQNYPNPFNPTTKIKFALKEQGMTTLMIYDILGREIARLVNEELPAGYYEVTLTDRSLASGIYIYRITSGNFTAVKKMLLVK
ncbi:DUF5123 domain-containing protein [Candidatus Neomarinimicrobiota bacterium]